MITRKQTLLSIVLLAVLTSPIVTPTTLAKAADTPQGPVLYRYKTSKGKMAVSQMLSPDIVQLGYDVISMRSGDVLQVIPPAPTKDEEKEILKAIEQEKHDHRLQLKYGSLAELMKSQKRIMAEVESKLSVLTGNQSNIKLQIDSSRAQAANYEREGRAIPINLLDKLADLYFNLEETEDLVRLRTQEIEDKRTQFAIEEHRYKEIKGLK